MKTKIIIGLGFFVLLASASAAILNNHNNKNIEPKELPGNMLIVVGIANNSDENRIIEIEIDVSAKSLNGPYNVKVTRVAKAFSKEISNLPIDEEIDVAVKAYDKKGVEIARGEQKIKLKDSNLTIAEFVLADEE